MTLEVDAIVRRDGFEVRAAFRAERGRTLALLGPNGAGKSTLVDALAGLVPVAGGRIALGERVLDAPERMLRVPPEARPIGVVFQDLLLFPHLSVLENVAFPLRAQGVSRDEARARARTLLERLGMAGRGSDRPSRLSGGQAQRVALARALVAEPELLLLDEPLSALDVTARVHVRDQIREELVRFPGVRLLVTHDPVEATMLADRLVLLEDGRVTQQGTPEEIRDAPTTHYAADLVGVNFFRGRLEPLDPGAGRLLTEQGEVVVAWPDDMVAGAAIGLLAPSDVVLHVEEPVGGSARNVLRGRVVSIAVEGDRARVRVASSPPIVAEITLGSAERLRIVVGGQVWASFKAVEVRVLPS